MARAFVCFWVSLLAGLAAGDLDAQFRPRAGGAGNTALQFSFQNPGARSLGFGGAFVALADDATAAFANPAGLTQLLEPEISIEVRHWRYSSEFTRGGRASGSPTGVGLDVTAGLRFDESNDSLTGIAFLSFVYPVKRWSIAVYRHLPGNFEVATEQNGLFLQVPGTDQTTREDALAVGELEIVSYGVSGAYRVSDRLRVGLGVSYFEVDFENIIDIYAPLPTTLPDGPFGENVFDPDARAVTATIKADDSAFGFNAGFLWQVSRTWSLGGFYRDGPTFDLTLNSLSGPALEPFVPQGTSLLMGTSPVGLPDSFGLGAAVKLVDGKFTISGEWNRVEYSDIIDDLDIVVFGTEFGRLDDADEFHLGAEYAFTGTKPIVAPRLGAWSDPDHRIRNEGPDPVNRAV